MNSRTDSRLQRWPCRHCGSDFATSGARTRHENRQHPVTPPAPEVDKDDFKPYLYQHHPYLNALPCDEDGDFLPAYTRPPSSEHDRTQEHTWYPFESRHDFDWANFVFVKQQLSEGAINEALNMWAARELESGRGPPWQNAKELYKTIDSIETGDTPFIRYTLRYQGPLPPNPPKWMTAEYELCVRNVRQVLKTQLSTPDFRDKMNFTPFRQFDGKSEKRIYSNFMSGDWAWSQADKIAEDPDTHGSMFVPIIAGSDKTTVSVATGHQEYHPVYMSPGNITNAARRAHGSAVLPVAFLPIVKARRRHRKSAHFQKFCRQMYHASLALLFTPLKAGMTSPEVIKCADGHFRRALYGLGPYIADYPEQVWLSGIVQGWCPKCTALPTDLDAEGASRRTHEKTDFLVTCFDPGILWDEFGVRVDVVPFTHGFPRADIHELLSPDLLHQVIKGTFKDHIVTWVNEYLILTHGDTRGSAIIDDIDRRISLVPAFPGIRRFPDGRDFSQWTGDDSKALMKVYLAAIAGHVPSAMVKCLSAFLDFCYMARRNALSEDHIEQLEQALIQFHHYRQIFVLSGVRADKISLPRQHSLKHYAPGIRQFGSPNGLCSSITESKHIKAVKEPWRRSSRFNALYQMLQTNARLLKMETLRSVFAARGWMIGTTLSYTAAQLGGEALVPEACSMGDGDTEEQDLECDEYGAAAGPRIMAHVELGRTPQRQYPSRLSDLARRIQQPELPLLVRQFLWDQLYPDSPITASEVPLDELPHFNGRVVVVHSAIAYFYAPSDLCGVGGMHSELIRSTPYWQSAGQERRDTVFVHIDASRPGMRGMEIGRVLLFFSFKHEGQLFPCAFVHWLVRTHDEPDEDTGMWTVKPERTANGRRRTASVIHIDSIARAAHLLPVYGSSLVPEELHFSRSLDVWRSYFVSPYADHHMHEFLKE